LVHLDHVSIACHYNFMQSSKKAFTLIELLVVIVIIGILVSLGVGNYLGVVDDSKYAAAETDMNSIRKAMLEYKVFHGELPLVGAEVDTIAGTGGTWASVVSALVSSGDLGEAINTDPWGNAYHYQDHDCNATTAGQSLLITAGPDGTVGNTDDFQVVVTEGCLIVAPTSTPTP